MIDFAQENRRRYIAQTLGKEPWITVNECTDTEESGVHYWCALAPSNTDQTEVLSHYTWDVTRGVGRFSFYKEKGDYIYKHFMEDGWEPLVYWRSPHGVSESWSELSDDFRLFFDLIPQANTKNLFYIQENGELEEVVRISTHKIDIKRNYLRHYLMLRKMILVLFFEFDVRASKDEIASNFNRTEIDLTTSSFCYNQHYNSSFSGKTRSELSRIMGKKIISPTHEITLNLWHLGIRPEIVYESFIIGEEESGAKIRFSCNPELLANYFGKNPENPHYLTPVFFRKEVLSRYLANPERYKIQDGSIICQGLWFLRIDNHHSDFVVVYLGDLGRDLPASEREYWLAFNVPPEGRTLSEPKLRRDFLAQWAEADRVEFVFKSKYKSFNQEFEKYYGWPFFLSLHTHDKHHFDNLHTPLNTSFQEFDSQILSLAHLMVDSLNEKQISTWFSEERGINRLEKALIQLRLPEVKNKLKILRDVQELRSKSSAHRKSNARFEKLLNRLNPDHKSLPAFFEQLLEQSLEFLNYLEIQFIEQPILTVKQHQVSESFDSSQIDIMESEFKLEEIINKIKNNQLTINPIIQSKSPWTRLEQSLFIESILARIPLPPFYLDISNSENWIVIDGFQRLNAIQQCVIEDQVFSESGLNLLEELHGKRFSELKPALKRRMLETVLKVYSIRPGTSQSTKYAVFKRLNQHSLSLTAHETRLAMSTQIEREFLGSFDNHPELIRLLSPIKSEHVIQEFILKILVRYQKPNVFFNSDKILLDYGMEILKEIPNLAQLQEQITTTIKQVINLFSGTKFLKKDTVGSEKYLQLIETWIVLCLSHEDDLSLILKMKPQIIQALEDLMADDAFSEAVLDKPNKKQKIIFRYQKIMKIIQEVIYSA